MFFAYVLLANSDRFANWAKNVGHRSIIFPSIKRMPS